MDSAIGESPTTDNTGITTLGVDRETRESNVLEIWRRWIDFPSQARPADGGYEEMRCELLRSRR